MMSGNQAFDKKRNQHPCYEIRLKGHLNDRRAEWFEGLTITLGDNGDTLLSGPVIDQAALHGLLKKVRDLGMTLISVSPVEPGQADMPDIKSSMDLSTLEKENGSLPHPYRSKKETK